MNMRKFVAGCLSLLLSLAAVFVGVSGEDLKVSAEHAGPDSLTRNPNNLSVNRGGGTTYNMGDIVFGPTEGDFVETRENPGQEQKYVTVLVVHAISGNFIKIFKDVPEDQIEYTEGKISSFPNDIGMVLTTNRIIQSQPYGLSDDEVFANVWMTPEFGDAEPLVTESGFFNQDGSPHTEIALISEREIFFNPDNMDEAVIIYDPKSDEIYDADQFLIVPVATE